MAQIFDVAALLRIGQIAVTVFGSIGLFVYALSHLGRHKRPARSMAIGIGILLLVTVCLQVVYATISRMVPAASIPVFFGALGVFSAIVHLIGLWFVARAVFMDRDENSSSQLPNAELGSIDADNPYASRRRP